MVWSERTVRVVPRVLALAFATAGCGESSRDDKNGGGRASTGGTGGGSGSGGTAGSVGGVSGAGGASTGGSSGTSGALVPYFRPGTRLKPELLVAGDVEQVFGRWNDVELGIRCVFGKTKDGVERCLPDTTLISSFTDAACTVPATRGPNRECAPDPVTYYATEVTGDDGCRFAEGFRVVREFTAPGALYVKNGDACEASGTADLDRYVWYELEPVPPETFVAVHYASRPWAPDLDAHVREGDDGSWEVTGFFDSDRGPCGPINAEPANRCVPTFLSASGFDATCRVPAALVEACEPSPNVLVVLSSDPNACPPTRSVAIYESTGPTETTLYNPEIPSQPTGACLVSNPEPVEAYIGGAVVESDSLPLIEPMELGTGRLRGRFAGSGGVPFAPPLGFWDFWFDSESGESCRPEFFTSDRTIWCRPYSFAGASSQALLFSSSLCDGAPLVAWTPSLCPPNPPTPAGYIIRYAPDDCGSATREETRRVTGTAAPSALYQVDSATGSCITVDPQDLMGLTFLELAEPVDRSEVFAEMRLEIRD